MTSDTDGGHSLPRAGRPAKKLDPTESQVAFLGFELRRARQAQSVTLTELARLTSYSAQHIGAVERGEAAPSHTFVTACDEALATGGRLATLLPPVIQEQAAQRHERQARRRPRSGSADAGTPVPADVSAKEGWQEVDVERLATMARRQSGPTRRMVEEDLEPITRRHRSLYHELTSAELVAPVVGHLGLLATLLECATDEIRRSLASILGETAGLAAWLYSDLGDVPQRDRMYRLADDALKTAGDLALSAYVHGFRASLLLHDGDRRRGIAELDVAEAQARRSAPLVTAAWLAALRAQARASVGEKAETLAALRHAGRQLERAGATASAEWMYDFDQGRLAGYRGACLLWLGEPRPAAVAIEDALARLPGTCTRRRADLSLDLAYARLFDREVPEARRLAGYAFELFAIRGSVPGLRRTARFHTRLLREGHASAARELEDQIRSAARSNRSGP